MGFVGTCGQPAEWRRSYTARLVCAITATMWGDCCVKPVGVDRNPSNGLTSAMKRPSKSGSKSAGQRLKKAEQDKATILWVDEAGFYLLPMAVRTWAPRGQTPRLARQTHPRSPLGDQWDYSRWTPLHASTSRLL